MKRAASKGAGPAVFAREPELVCWTRMQAEAGQGLEQILARKELERQAGDGLFAWGIGTPPALAIRALARMGARVPVIFSIMKSKPRPVDADPAATYVWRAYVDCEGVQRSLPTHCLVTSRGDSTGAAKRAHYALLCRSPKTLHLERGQGFDPQAYRNAGGTGAPVGASQVTALLRRVAPSSANAAYQANMQAELADSYWVRLADPVPLAPAMRRALDAVADMTPAQWTELVTSLRGAHRRPAKPEAMLL